MTVCVGLCTEFKCKPPLPLSAGCLGAGGKAQGLACRACRPRERQPGPSSHRLVRGHFKKSMERGIQR